MIAPSDVSVYERMLKDIPAKGKMNTYQRIIEAMGTAGYDRERIRTFIGVEPGYFSVLISTGKLTHLFARKKQTQPSEEPLSATQQRALLYGARLGRVGPEVRAEGIAVEQAFHTLLDLEKQISAALQEQPTLTDAATQTGIPYLAHLLAPVSLEERAAVVSTRKQFPLIDRVMSIYARKREGYSRAAIAAAEGITESYIEILAARFHVLKDEPQPKKRRTRTPKQPAMPRTPGEAPAPPLTCAPDYTTLPVRDQTPQQPRRLLARTQASTAARNVREEPLEQRIAATAQRFHVSEAFLHSLIGVQADVHSPQELTLLRASTAYRLFAQNEPSQKVKEASGLSAQEVTRIAAGTHEAGTLLTTILHSLNGLHAGSEPYMRSSVQAVLRAELASRTNASKSDVDASQHTTHTQD